MPDFRLVETATVVGVTYSSNSTITSEGAVIRERTIPVAKVGALTTRTDANTGELTMAASHGITTGARLDIYWDGGSRRGVVVGTVATNAVPIDLGDGDDLPPDETAITAQVPIEEEFLCTGNDVAALALYASARGTIVLAESDDGEATAQVLGDGNAKSWFWTPSRNPTNPLASADVAKVFFSQASSTAEATLKATAFVD